MSMIMAMTSLALTHAGHALPAISFAVAMHVIGMFGLSLPLGHLADRLGRRHVMLGGTVAAGARARPVGGAAPPPGGAPRPPPGRVAPGRAQIFPGSPCC